ncbi:uncharacterized protein LOC132722680 [Ruditapes philippinarum]|uniref:uncharacterized protein LOC132722680 n=1 Tax=Ruditapes philippinarum TaxID=129788 RepID=UPI00295C2A3F|nr:uncharacterized protein LOC132722680 [Ruditapes philippinarum]
MTEETVLSFSVVGLTVDYNVDNWVPKKGQRLLCSLCYGCIEVFKDGQCVGKVAKEAPNTCKEWLESNGKLEAVVISVPKKHRNKGREVPVVFVFKSVKSCLMENIKRGIKSGISSLQKKKKSVSLKDGDSTENVHNVGQSVGPSLHHILISN